MAVAPRRILVLSNFFTEGHGGTPESILLLAQQLSPLGIACDVACDKGVCQDAGVYGRLPRMDEMTKFTPTLAISRYSAVFVAGSWNVRAPLLVLRAWLAGLPVVYAAKGCLSRAEFTRARDLRRIPYLLLIEWWLLCAARYVIFTSCAERDSYVVPSWLWRRKMAIIPEPFRGVAVSPHVAGGGRLVGFMAEISPRKGLLELIAGFGAFLTEHPGSGVRLRIVGTARTGAQDYLAQCKALAERNGSQSQIEWCSSVRGCARDRFYAELDLFVCPSRFESFGLTVLEALWQGTPVCAGPRLGVLEFLKTDVPVLRMPSLRGPDIAAALAAVVCDEWPRGDVRAWAGCHAGTQSNRDIAQAFALLLSC